MNPLFPSFRHVHLASSVCLSLLFLSGCGSESTIKKETPGVFTPIESTEIRPVFLQQQDKNCTPKNGVSQLGPVALHTWTPSGRTLQPVDTTGLNSQNGLHNSFVTEVLTGLVQESQLSCEWSVAENSYINCEPAVGSPASRNPVMLSICREGYQWPRDSLEHAALASLIALEKGFVFYSGLQEEKKDLGKASLALFPELRTVKTADTSIGKKSETTWQTNNAAWTVMNKEGASGVFIVFNHTADWYSLGDVPSLWEIPFVMIHEMGHHVFYKNSPGLKDLIFERSDVSADTFRMQHDFWKPPRLSDSRGSPRVPEMPLDPRRFANTTSSGPADITPGEALVAVNEAAADLFAFYTLDGKPGLLEGAPCLGANRDVSSPQFLYNIEIDGSAELVKKAKSLDTKSLKLFTSASEFDEKVGSCTYPSLDDPHFIGAILAHGFDRLFAAAGTGETPQQRGNLLIKWIQTMDQDLSQVAEPTAEGVLLSSVRTALKVATEDTGKISTQQCETLLSVFPGYENKAFKIMENNGSNTCVIHGI